MHLTSKERDFLFLLLSNVNQTIEYDRIFSFVWGEKDIDYTYSIRTIVKQLRKKLPDDLLQNVSGLGYKITL